MDASDAIFRKYFSEYHNLFLSLQFEQKEFQSFPE